MPKEVVNEKFRKLFFFLVLNHPPNYDGACIKPPVCKSY